MPTPAGRLTLHFGEGEHLDVTCDADADTVTIDRSRAGADADSHGGGASTATAAGAFDGSSDRPAVRIFLDGSVVEVFTSAGRVLTTRVYPENPPPWRIEAPHGCTVWQLRA